VPEVAARARLTRLRPARGSHSCHRFNSVRGPTPQARGPEETAPEDLQEDQNPWQDRPASRAALEKAIAGPATRVARLVDGAKPQKPKPPDPLIPPAGGNVHGTQNRTPEPVTGPRRKRHVGARPWKRDRTRGNRIKPAKGNNPTSDAERASANAFGKAVIRPGGSGTPE
jgi:hypothetical protein